MVTVVNSFSHKETPGLDNFCAFLETVCLGIEPETAMRKYDLFPGVIPGSLPIRDAEIVRLRKLGLTYEQIGIQTCCSDYVAYRTCKKAGLVV